MTYSSKVLEGVNTTGLMKRRSVHGAAAILIAQLVKFVLQFGSQIILARLLDPAQYGLMAMTAPVLGFVQVISDLGLGQAVVQRPGITNGQVSALFWVNVAVSAVLAAGVCLLSPAFAWLYGEPQIIPIVDVLGCLIVVSGATIVPTALLNRQMRFIPLAIIDVASVVCATVVAIAAASAGLGTWALVIAQVTVSLTVLTLTWLFAGWTPSRPMRNADIGSLLRFGVHLTGGNIAGYLSFSADRMLIGLTTGKVSLGLYDRSYRLVSLPLAQLMAPIGRVATPLLSRLNDSDERFQRIYLQMLQLTNFCTVPTMLFGFVMAKPVVAIIFGEKWIEAAPIFEWICFGGIATSTFCSTFWIFTSQGRSLEQMRLSWVVSLINVVSFAAGLPWGAVGVAAVSGVSFVLVQTPILVWGATRTGAVSLNALTGALAPFFLAAAITAGVLSRLPSEGMGLLGLLAAACMSYAVFAAVLACLASGRQFFGSALSLARVLRKAD